MFFCMCLVGEIGGFCEFTKLLLSRAKAELSPHIHHLSKTPGAINQEIKKIISYIDSIVLECEGATAKDYLTKKEIRSFRDCFILFSTRRL